MNGTDPLVTILPWGEDDLPVLQRSNTPEMTRFLGGPETPEKLADRHHRYLRLNESGEAHMFRIDVDGDSAGGIGYWRIDHGGEPAYETGWSVHTGYQRRGIAARALALCIADVRSRGEPERRWLYAFPKPENAASNRLCAHAGFTFVGQDSAEYPKSVPIIVNVWRFDLRG